MIVSYTYYIFFCVGTHGFKYLHLTSQFFFFFFESFITIIFNIILSEYD